MDTESREINLVLISELAREILAQHKLHVYNLDRPTFTEIMDHIWDLYPAMYHEEDYGIYWRFSKEEFLKVCDFYSYFTAFTLMAENTFYLILRDSGHRNFEENSENTGRDGEVLLEALEEWPCPRYYTQSYKQIYRIIDDGKRGYKKEKMAQVLPNDNVINMRPKIQIKSDKGGKDKGGKDKGGKEKGGKDKGGKDKKGKDDKKDKKKK